MRINLKDYRQLILEIRKQDVDAFDHATALDFLQHLRTDVINYEGKLSFIKTGYENDPRELFEIPEVIKFIDFLDRCFPYWFYFFIKELPKHQSPVTLLLSIKLAAKRISVDGKVGKLEFDADAYNEFMNIHFHFLNELTDELGLPESENRRITKEVIDSLDLFVSEETDSNS